MTKTIPFGAVRLKIPIDSYLSYLAGLPGTERPPVYKIVPVEGYPFDVVIYGRVTVNGDMVQLDGKTTTIL